MADKVKETEKKTKVTEQPEERRLWVHDPLEIVHTDVSDSGVMYTVRFLDFLGLAHTINVKREDCYFAFVEKVLKPLVRLGFRFNTTLPAAISAIQAQLTAYRPDSKTVAEAVKKAQEAKKADKAE